MIRPAAEFAAVVLCIVTLAVVVILQFAPGTPEDGGSIPVFAGDIPDTDGPMTYFVNNCSRCHGPADNAYVEFKNPKRGDPLRAMIKTMAEGPAMAASDPETIDQQYDLHLAIIDKRPWAWIDPNQTSVIAGEIIPGTNVYLRTDTGVIRAAVDSYGFALPDEPGKIEIERDGKRVPLDRPQGD